jgi:hypothetical protein
MVKKYLQVQGVLVLSIMALGVYTVSASDERQETSSTLVQMMMHCQHDSVAITLQTKRAALPIKKVVITPLQSTVTSSETSHAIISQGDDFVSQRKTFEYFKQCCHRVGAKEAVITNLQPGSPLFDCYKAAQHKIERPHQGDAWYLYKKSPMIKGSTYGDCW